MAGHIFDMGFAKYILVVDPGKFIVVAREGEEQNTFEIGDPAEYDSYNLLYVGIITAITDKTVTIQPKYENKKRRLKLEEFAWRNWNFNAERVAQENFETSHYI